MSDDTSLADEQFYGAIGRLTISWAHTEFGLDCMAEIIHHGFGGKDIEPEIPRSLSRKLTYLRKAFRRLPIPEEALNGHISLFDAISAESGMCHDIIHGFLLSHEKDVGRAILMRATRDRDGKVTKRQVPVRTGDILTAANRAYDLGNKVFFWVNGFHETLDEVLSESDGHN